MPESDTDPPEIAYDDRTELEKWIHGKRITAMHPIFVHEADTRITVSPPPVITKPVLLCVMEIMNCRGLLFCMQDQKVRVIGPDRKEVPADIDTRIGHRRLIDIIRFLVPGKVLETDPEDSIRSRAKRLEKR